MKKPVKITIITVAVIAAAVVGLSLKRKSKTTKKVENVTYRVNKETYENVIEVSGTVAAAQEQKLQALSSGTVLEVYVNKGDHVKKGDILIQLDDTEQIYNLEKQEYNMATKKVSGSARELKLMETERLSLLRKVNDRKVVATFDGVIADLDVAVGDSLEAKDSIGTIVNVDYLTAEVEITETDVSKLRVGQDVEFTFPAYPKSTVLGHVTGWPAIGELTSRGATIVKADIRIDNYPSEILPNYSFTGKIQISPKEEYLVVERYAIGYEDKEPYVILAKTGEKKSVKVQQYGKEYVKVLEGVKEGDILKEVSPQAASGQNRNRGNNNGGGRNNGGNGGGGGMGGMPGGGPGGPF